MASYQCSQEPHPGVEFYGADSGCAECGYRPATQTSPEPPGRTTPQQPSNQEERSMTSPNDILFGSSTPSAKFVSPGDTITGRIVKLGASQQTDFKTREPKTWPNGDPMMQVEVSVQTNLRDPSIEDDDGVRKVYVKGKSLTNAVRDAVRAVGAKGLDEGGTLTVTYTGDGPAERGMSAPKLYEVSYAKPDPATAANQALGLTPAATPAPAPVAQPAPAPQAAAAPAAAPAAQPDLASLAPEAQALIAQMLAKQQQAAAS